MALKIHLKLNTHLCANSNHKIALVQVGHARKLFVIYILKIEFTAQNTIGIIVDNGDFIIGLNKWNKLT